MEPRPPGQGGDLGDRFRRMNVNAQSFVPNVQARSFVPLGPYGGYPPMHGEIGAGEREREREGGVRKWRRH